MTQPTVVVVESADTQTPPASVPAGPEYVTVGELDARLSLLRNEISESVSSALETAWAARDAAETAADDAAVATAVAVEAAAAVDEAGEDDDEVDGEGDGDLEDDDETPQAPPKRTTPAPVKGSGVGKSRSYGASFLSGR